MQPCDELKTLVLQLSEKETFGGLLVGARRLYSQQAGVMLIGSDPHEWFEDIDSIIHFYAENDASGLEITVDRLRAYQEDAVGWVIDRVIAKLPNGHAIPVRHTYLFHQENEDWKIVHAHISVEVPTESIGER